MCDHDDTVDLVLTIHGRLIDGVYFPAKRKTCPIDRCIAPIVAALEAGGVKMLGSCCGHGESPGSIRLVDGRELTISKA